MTTAAMKSKRLAPWFGANTELAGEYARQIGKVRWCAVPFAGGMCELPLIQTAAGVASDLHRHIINLVRVVRDTDAKSELVELLRSALFHPDELRAAQRACVVREERFEAGLFGPSDSMPDKPDPAWAAQYYLACWMGRGGHAGKGSEFTQGLALRYTSTGGDSAKRLQSAIESLEAWHLALRRWSFDLCDGIDLIRRVYDHDGHAIYCDPPWPGAGDEYKHRVGEAFHVRLRDELLRFKSARVVIRYGEHPLIRDLYPAERWTIVGGSSRNQRNNECAEIMIINGTTYGTVEGTA